VQLVNVHNWQTPVPAFKMYFDAVLQTEHWAKEAQVVHPVNVQSSQSLFVGFKKYRLAVLQTEH
jgi:hypothetical protein